MWARPLLAYCVLGGTGMAVTRIWMGRDRRSTGWRPGVFRGSERGAIGGVGLLVVGACHRLARTCSASGPASASSRSRDPCGGIRGAWRGPWRGTPGRSRVGAGRHPYAALSEHPLEHVAQRGCPRVIAVEGVAIGAARGEAGHQRIHVLAVKGSLELLDDAQNVLLFSRCFHRVSVSQRSIIAVSSGADRTGVANYLEEMVGRDGIEPPTPGFSGPGLGETIGHYRAQLETISALCAPLTPESFPIPPDGSDTVLTQRTH